MSKKKHPKNQRRSARDHVEGNVIRWREKKELIRVDREGNPIVRGKTPINTFDKNWLSSHLNPEVSAPPTIPMKEPPPNNVTSIADARNSKASKPEPQPGNEALKQSTFKPENGCNSAKCSDEHKHGWLHNKWLAGREFANWARQTKEVGRKRCGSELWINKDGKLSSPSLEKQRELSKQGHTKLKFKHPPSVNHNPFLKPDSGGYAVPNSSKPLDPKFYMPPRQGGSQGKTPSGQLIRGFTHDAQSKNAVVYTTPPPTPTRDWRVALADEAANDAEPHTLDKARATRVSVQWFINHVEPQNWPSSYHELVRWTNDGPMPNVGAINKAVNQPESELALLKATNAGLEKDWKMLDSALTDATSENNLLRQELELTKQELASERQASNLMEYHIAQSNGVDPDVVREKYIVKSKTPQVPDDADVMLRELRMYQSFERVYGPAHAFARFVYGDPSLGQTMVEHADMRCKERQAEVQYRNLVRMIKDVSNHILSEMQAEYEQQKYDSYVNFWKEQYPVYLKQRARRTIGVVRDPSRESVALAAMARKAKPATFSSIYYSTPVLYDERYRAVNNTIAKRILMDVKPTQPRYNNPRCVDHDTRKSWAQPTFKGMASYEKWWADRLDWCEVHYHEIKHPVKVGVVKTYNWLVDKLNTPVDPITRSRQAKLREQLRQHQHELDERREARKEERVEAKKRKAERDHIRKMQRIAY